MIIVLKPEATPEITETLLALISERAGAPKIRATELLRGTEMTKRGPYGGAIGWINGEGMMDSAVVIRTAVVRDGTALVRARAARAIIHREADLELEAVSADAVLGQMQEAGHSTNIIILDACRNMPLTQSFRSGSPGLAPMNAPSGSFIAYSTGPGQVAADGAGANSPFAIALLREIAQPGQPIETVFRNVRREVLHETGGLQTRWDSSSLVEPFYFRP
jgi:hypothetical protein